jgi:two-component system cell cycle sensor histidine kinase/response regulator CckA
VKRSRILIVEDEGLVARDIQMTLQRLGYDVPPPVATGEDAIAAALALEPDLVLMDIRLRGKMDGIEAAEVLRRDGRAPVVFLTAHSDEATLARAKKAEPFGYVVKPFEETDLRTAIEVALYKHAMDLRVRRSEELLSGILDAMSDAVITTDQSGRIVYVNPAAVTLLRMQEEECVGKPLAEVLRISVPGGDEQFVDALLEVPLTRQPRALDGLHLESAKGGESVPIRGVASAVHDGVPGARGLLLVLRDERPAARIRELVRERDLLRARLHERVEDLV